MAAIATPHGRGGIGILRLSGPQSAFIACAMSGQARVTPRHATMACWRDAASGVIDRGIQLYFSAPASYTGEDVVELQGHGNPILLRALLDRALELGAEPAAPGGFTRQAIEHGKMDLSQAEAVVATIDAATLRAAHQAQRQLDGHFGRFISDCMERLTDLVATVEACLDFAEEELPLRTMAQLRDQVRQLITDLERALATAATGERLFNGVNVVIIGAPNVGKSTLLNALCGRDRAIVSAIAGTTRDILEADLEIDGIPLRLLDTAGLHESSDTIEQEGMRRAKVAAEQADLVLLVADASDDSSWHSPIHANIYLMNKCDLAPELPIPKQFIAISARSGEGLDQLRTALRDHLDTGSFSGEEDYIITSARHRQAVSRARDHLIRGDKLLSGEETLDIAALEWRCAWSSLGEILGIGDVEQILDRIFATFCIGK
ncbi:MAG: tRNA uridine-5-carboxymethylaminomethyl(34) synthesis GTPase MnmE [Mariprofundales bacterium]|nr:tRNA uridine-5-carboxymethylaminomethyl(34) synthesis GTPase MnmE [Mariprofundales bacterium]